MHSWWLRPVSLGLNCAKCPSPRLLIAQPKERFSFSSPVTYTKFVPNLRSCLVSFTDPEGVEHSVRVPAESLYEAAVEAMAAFRHGVLADIPLGPATRLTIQVKPPEEAHSITVAKVMSWLDGGARSPNEQARKNRLRERLRS